MRQGIDMLFSGLVGILIAYLVMSAAVGEPIRLGW